MVAIGFGNALCRSSVMDVSLLKDGRRERGFGKPLLTFWECSCRVEQWRKLCARNFRRRMTSIHRVKSRDLIRGSNSPNQPNHGPIRNPNRARTRLTSPDGQRSSVWTQYISISPALIMRSTQPRSDLSGTNTQSFAPQQGWQPDRTDKQSSITLTSGLGYSFRQIESPMECELLARPQRLSSGHRVALLRFPRRYPVPAYLRGRVLAHAVLCLLLGTALPARANSVTVIGNGYAGGDSDGLSLTAGIFSAFSAAPDGRTFLGGGGVGVPLTLSWDSLAFPGPGFTSVNLGSQFTDILTGGIAFTGTFTVPASALVTGTFTAPVDVSGQLQAFQDLTLGQGGYTQGPLMATLVFSGTGTATFQIESFGATNSFLIGFTNVNFNNTGTLTPVPEPTSLFLMSTGFAGLSVMVMRRRRGFFPDSSRKG